LFGGLRDHHGGFRAVPRSVGRHGVCLLEKKGFIVTSYAVDEDAITLLRTWPTGRGQRAAVVSKLPATAAVDDQLRLVAALTSLSEALWRCYTHPGSAADDQGVNGEGWRREQTREAYTEVTAWIRKPNLPDADGAIIESYDPVEERAHRVGRALHAINDARLTETVCGDVTAEIQAVEAAERGDLNGRAVQAVVLSRADASPIQIAAADDLLAQNPLGGEALCLGFDPTAASVAAAHWLKAAADVVAEVSGIPATRVLFAADDIEALPVETPNEVLDLFGFSDKAYRIVVEMVSDAMLVAEGIASDFGALVVKYDAANDEDSGPDDESTPVRLTPLDPQRPALDLLEDLIIGIRGCRLVYEEYVDADEDASIDAQFCEAVREEARKNYTRII
jgi:hypothetical protein